MALSPTVQYHHAYVVGDHHPRIGARSMKETSLGTDRRVVLPTRPIGCAMMADRTKWPGDIGEGG